MRQETQGSDSPKLRILHHRLTSSMEPSTAICLIYTRSRACLLKPLR